MKIGVLGGGQLGRMLAMSAYPLDVQVVCVDQQQDACANQVCPVLVGQLSDETLLKKFVEQVDVITYETENTDLTCAKWLAQYKPVLPDVNILAVAQDRLLEKKLFQEFSIPTAPFIECRFDPQSIKAIQALQFPLIVKTRRFGYDGKGQWIIKNIDEFLALENSLKNTPCIVEGFVKFDQEVSLIAVRNQVGEARYYPLVENVHQHGILRHSRPFSDPILQQQAQHYAAKILQQFNYCGVLTVEFFVRDKQLIANEMAPRVHNSGHWTIEGAMTSQFENHLRALTNLPLGATEKLCPVQMWNMISEPLPREKILAIHGAHYHHYGKAARENRKVGHVTLIGNDEKVFQKNAEKMEQLFS